jgi:very-short-patch-repair endonuclease
LRRHSTIPERILWGMIRGGRLGGLKFRRQHPIGPFFADYYCHEAKLIVELDGMSHDSRGEADRRREG